MNRFYALVLFFVCSTVARADTTTKAITKLMEENCAAATAEDLPRVLATMSSEMPQRDLFIEQCKREWAETSSYHKVENVKVVRTRGAYAIAIITQTVVTQTEAEDADADHAPDPELSHAMSLHTDVPTTQIPMLFKREKGKWKLVAGLAPPQPVSNGCSDGNCQFPRTR